MIRSMTAYGNAKAESPQGTLSVEMRSVNNRFLDINLRLPDDLRYAEGPIRERLAQQLQRGKLDIRLSYQLQQEQQQKTLPPEVISHWAHLLQQARHLIPDMPPPGLTELVQQANANHGLDADVWLPLCLEALDLALSDLQSTRLREGQRLADMMLAVSQDMSQLVQELENNLPALLVEQQAKISKRLSDTLLSVSPDGFAHISGEELSARIAQESSLFALRIDVAEELARLRSHISELQLILQGDHSHSNNKRARQGSTGKRLDFLFQEMNREANTLGSKASNLDVTNASISLKLLIEQLREQAQNIE
ncbi:YicC/YloC family endoribonuclease [Alcaligenes endophyticus]|uniref:YicC family protein n=1 Tax=Alcaligenes endophyticus TaxID=1929088 RepID=A0ABT8EJN8_9BURK|nr:YicC/YloC family endoribonuclease [Alcaligenes endophyticus]MCX5591832.1 YicC family protein [Alcaligenes endophyticus]MDN4121509.1 YicC family protein [Alcaligenes endophyticus]